MPPILLTGLVLIWGIRRNPRGADTKIKELLNLFSHSRRQVDLVMSSARNNLNELEPSLQNYVKMKDKNPNLEVIDWAKQEARSGNGVTAVIIASLVFAVSSELAFYNMRTDLHELRSKVSEEAIHFREYNYRHESPPSTVLPKDSRI